MLALQAASCGPRSPGPPTGAKSFTDGLGRTVSIEVPVKRIVSIAPSNTEILFAIGAGALVAGRDDFSSFPPEAGAIRKVGSGSSLDLEAVVGLRPDLVLAAEISNPDQIRTLDRLGVPVYLVANPRTFEGLGENIRFVGQLTGHEAGAERLAGTIEARVKAVTERVRLATTRPRVFYELDATDPSQPWTSGPGTFLSMLIQMAGGENLGAAHAESFPRISAEKLIREDPDVIILGDAVFGITVESVRQRAGWGLISAVQRGRVHPFDDDLASRPGPRLVEGLEVLAKLLHPELFEVK